MIETFHIIPASSRAIWVVFGLILLLFLGVVAILFTTGRGSTQSRFELSDEGLRIHGDLYGQLIRRTSLKGGSARVVNLDVDTALAPKRRSMGTAVPGYRAGWFRLRNGREALVYLTDRTQAVHVPTTAGFDLLINPQDPERFVERLRAIAPKE
jgi:hypothetical protein